MHLDADWSAVSEAVCVMPPLSEGVAHVGV